MECKKCGSTKVIVIKESELEEKMGSANFKKTFSGSSNGVISPADAKLVLVALRAIAGAVRAFFEWLTEKEKRKSENDKNDKKIDFCIDCHYWERVKD